MAAPCKKESSIRGNCRAIISPFDIIIFQFLVASVTNIINASIVRKLVKNNLTLSANFGWLSGQAYLTCIIRKYSQNIISSLKVALQPRIFFQQFPKYLIPKYGIIRISNKNPCLMNMFMRKKVILFLSSAVIIHFLFIFAKSQPLKPVNSPFSDVSSIANASDNLSAIAANAAIKSNLVTNRQLSVYDELDLSKSGLSRYAFDYAVKGYDYLLSVGKLKNDQIISIVDFSQASSKKRLYIIDLRNKKVLFNTYVSHGRNSGKEMANEFSNEPESNKSSLGFYVTGDTYMGKHGFSMRLFGEEKGINDNANSRAIVMHSAPYVSEGAIKMQGFVGRSLGCPALPENLYKPIIETIKNGSCLFLYSPDKYYASHSDILKKVA